MPEDESISGLILRAQSGFFDVETDAGMVRCQMRGRLTQRRLESDVVAAGDRVQVSLLEPGVGVIESVEPRARVLSRRAPSGKREQILLANPDQVAFVFAAAEPEPNLRLLDRLLVAAEREALPAVIIVNKIDLTGRKAAAGVFGIYEELGYPVFYVSAKSGKGIPELRKQLRGRVSALAGKSGVGKSSLLNAIQPGAGLPTQELSQATGKGRHATVFPELIPLSEGGHVADTPGLKAFALWDIEPEEVDAYFRELRPLVQDCAFSDCSHLHEPDCAVVRAVEEGRVDPGRYESYVRIRLGEDEDAPAR
ncbi:MAG TPA: ribosome small subunit-dependent GTPase A [Anaerolineales bacterium]|nr:ribosome small subunit-dependent GTPase A [Anaerolineales bacterium]